jgi:hypothetical protein
MAAKGFNRIGVPVHLKFDCILLTVMTVCGFFLAKSGVVLGHGAWLPFPEIRYEQFGLTRLMAVSWDNMITLSVAFLLVIGYARSFGHYRQYLLEFTEATASASGIKSTNRYLRALTFLPCVPAMLAICVVCETLCPSPGHNIVSIFLDGVLFRSAMLCIFYYFLSLTPYAFAREYLIFTKKFTLPTSDSPENRQ